MARPTQFFKNGNERCRLRELPNGTFEVAIISIEENGEVEVYYLERFRNFENALQALLNKGICGGDEFSLAIPREGNISAMEARMIQREREYWLEACI